MSRTLAGVDDCESVQGSPDTLIIHSHWVCGLGAFAVFCKLVLQMSRLLL